jgi:transposase
MNDARLQKLLRAGPVEGSHKRPDYEHIHREMAKSGVTLSLLWSEYCESCRQSGELPFMYTQFCKYYRDYAVLHKATMHIDHKPGEQMEVDWAGQTLGIIDNITGEIIPAYVFVAVLSCSGYAYAEAFLLRDQATWISAHVNAFRHFSGATRLLVPDNLKTGVERISWYTPIINKTYQELAEHYGTAVLPARVRKPKDKPSVEGTVGVISTWIIAALRNGQFFSLSELNEAVHDKLDEFNRKPFQKKPGSRLSVFLEEEKHMLLPLPRHPFELAVWKVATVAFNYHVSVEKMMYSVPYEYIKHKVDVRITQSTIEIFFHGNRIASHVRLRGKTGRYSTLPEHMPEDHRKYTQWNAERFITWARSIGENTESVARSILASRQVEQQSYRSCMALLKLGDKYSLPRLEAACRRALSYTLSPSFKSIQTILATGQDKLVDEPATTISSSEFGFTRGADYYGRNKS